MNHNEYKEKLSAFLDGELSETERTDVLAHLEGCEECQTYLAELTAMRDAFGDMEDIDAPDGFSEGVLARLHEEPATRVWTAAEPKKRRAWRSWAALAACAAVVVLAVTTLPQMRMGNSADSAASGSTSSSMSIQSTMTTSSAPAAAAPETAEPMMTADTAADADEAAEYVTEAAPEESEVAGAPMVSIANGESRLLDKETPESADAYPVLYLYGEGAADWLAENGESLGDGTWRVTVEMVNALPDTLELVAGDGVQEPIDGALIIMLAETEDAP